MTGDIFHSSLPFATYLTCKIIVMFTSVGAQYFKVVDHVIGQHVPLLKALLYILTTNWAIWGFQCILEPLIETLPTENVTRTIIK